MMQTECLVLRRRQSRARRQGPVSPPVRPHRGPSDSAVAGGGRARHDGTGCPGRRLLAAAAPCASRSRREPTSSRVRQVGDPMGDGAAARRRDRGRRPASRVPLAHRVTSGSPTGPRSPRRPSATSSCSVHWSPPIPSSASRRASSSRLIDPPESSRAGRGGMPKRRHLAGARGRGGHPDTMLSSPIILYDYPPSPPRAPATSSTAPRSTRSSRSAS